MLKTIERITVHPSQIGFDLFLAPFLKLGRVPRTPFFRLLRINQIRAQRMIKTAPGYD